MIGEESRVRGFALGGATVIAAEEANDVCRAVGGLGDDVAVVVLTAHAAAALGDEMTPRGTVLTVVMPP